MKTFKEKYLNGEVTIENIDDFVEEWHRNSKSDKTTLQDFLGFTKEEMDAFIQGEKVLESKLNTLKHKSVSMLKEVLTELLKK